MSELYYPHFEAPAVPELTQQEQLAALTERMWDTQETLAEIKLARATLMNVMKGEAA